MNRGTVYLICVAILVLPTAVSAQTQAQAQTPGPLFPVQQNGNWGYIDGAGKIVVEPRFAGA